MKWKLFLSRYFIVIIVFAAVIIGCDLNSETTYTVWTSTESYSEYLSVFGALNDGYYRKIEVFSGEINYSVLPNEYKRNWTENEIYNWFLGRGFISSEANEVKAWVITTKHCIIASRSGNIVHMLIK